MSVSIDRRRDKALEHAGGFLRSLAEMVEGASSSNRLLEDERLDLIHAGEDLNFHSAELLNVIDGLPSVAMQEHAIISLWGILGGAFVVGKLAVKNPIIERWMAELNRDRAAMARAGKTPRLRLLDMSIQKHASELWAKNAKRKGNALGTAREIVEAVNSDLDAEGHKPTTERQIRGRLARPN